MPQSHGGSPPFLAGRGRGLGSRYRRDQALVDQIARVLLDALGIHGDAGHARLHRDAGDSGRDLGGDAQVEALGQDVIRPQ